MAAAAMLAASLLLMAPPAARAEPPRGIVFRAPAAHGGGPVMRAPVMRAPAMSGGTRFAAPARSFAGPRGNVRVAAAPPRFQGHFDGDRHDWGHDGDRRDWGHDGDHRDWGHDGDWHRDWDDHPRYAVPPHWVGLHPDWDGPRPGYWVRPWGPRWVPGYWSGGYWGGTFWPHVYLDWDFPWFFASLPAGCVTYWWGGVPYYYWQGVYYVWSPDYGQYVVTDPPPVTGGVATGAAAPPAAQPAQGDSRGALSLYVYPKNGQSRQQTDNDRYQCHEWAVGQTGFDPTNPAGDTHASTATPSNYKRAVTACLEARGYSVR
jgi:hypothetical protein